MIRMYFLFFYFYCRCCCCRCPTTLDLQTNALMLRAIVPTAAVTLSTRLNVFGWNRHRHDVLTAQEHLLNATRSLF